MPLGIGDNRELKWQAEEEVFLDNIITSAWWRWRPLEKSHVPITASRRGGVENIVSIAIGGDAISCPSM